VFADEAPLAARTAALYPNMEHVVVRASARSPLANLDRRLYLNDAPSANLCNAVWLDAINDDVRARGLTVLLTGQQGNFTLTYNGMERLPELLAQGRLLTLLRESLLLKRNGHRSLKGAAARTVGAYAPGWLWRLAMARAEGGADARRYAAVPPERWPGLEAEARATHPDLDYRPWKRAFDLRLWGLRRADLAPYSKGALGGWGIDTRDPTADRRLVEFCLSIPTEQYLRDGVPKALARAALADRLAPETLQERRLGRQAVDWHEGMTADLESLAAEIERIGASDAAAGLVDVPRLRALASNWPRGGWHSPEVNTAYRIALLRAVSAGHFIRRASGGNA
jgi:asparagine synthase (glutamine-hydrolysing)